jgi:hypothetical protein
VGIGILGGSKANRPGSASLYAFCGLWSGTPSELKLGGEDDIDPAPDNSTEKRIFCTNDTFSEIRRLWFEYAYSAGSGAGCAKLSRTLRMRRGSGPLRSIHSAYSR